MEVSSGIGFIVGPFLGGVLYQFFGYQGPFIIFSLFELISSPIIYKLMKKRIKRQEHILEDENPLQERPKEKITKSKLKQVFKNFTIVSTIFMIVLSTLCYMYFRPIQAQFFITEYNIKAEQAGYLMTVVSITYIAASFLLGYVKYDKIKLVLIGNTLTAISFFYEGPDKTFTGIGHNLWVIIIAQGILGIGSATAYITSLPLLNELLIRYFPEDTDKCADMASTLFNGACFLGEFIGPLVGGFMTGWFGYVSGCSYTGLFYLLFSALYAPLICRKKQHKGEKFNTNTDSTATTLPKSPTLTTMLTPRKTSIGDIEIETVTKHD